MILGKYCMVMLVGCLHKFKLVTNSCLDPHRYVNFLESCRTFEVDMYMHYLQCSYQWLGSGHKKRDQSCVEPQRPWSRRIFDRDSWYVVSLYWYESDNYWCKIMCLFAVCNLLFLFLKSAWCWIRKLKAIKISWIMKFTANRHWVFFLGQRLLKKTFMQLTSMVMMYQGQIRVVIIWLWKAGHFM